MTIQDWGSLGELIAAVATVATLIYLALQIRANTIVSKAEARRATRVAAGGVSLAIVENGEVARIFRAGLGDPSKLEPEEWIRFSFLMGQLVGAISAAFDEVDYGVLSEDSISNQKVLIKQFLPTPGGQKFWQQFGPTYPDEFREFVRGLLSETP